MPNDYLNLIDLSFFSRLLLGGGRQGVVVLFSCDFRVPAHTPESRRVYMQLLKALVMDGKEEAASFLLVDCGRVMSRLLFFLSSDFD